jgi:hypothetical protein
MSVGWSRVAPLIVIPVLLPVSSCGSQPADPRCKGGTTAPISIAALQAALTAERVDGMRLAKSSLFCGDPDIPAYVSNYDTSSKRLGLTACIVRKTPIYSDVQALKTKGAIRDGKVRFFLQNVECSVYPHGNRGAQQARRVRVALLRLAGAPVRP